MSAWHRIAWRSSAMAPWRAVAGAPIDLHEALDLLRDDAAGHEFRHTPGDGGTYLEWHTVAHSDSANQSRSH